MPRYAISFDLDRTALENDGYTPSQINNDVYKREIQAALDSCGFTEHPEGSVYHTGNLNEEDSLAPIVKLQSALKTHAPTFCKYVRSIHLFKMEGWSNITSMIQDSKLPGCMVPKGAPKAAPAAAATAAAA